MTAVKENKYNIVNIKLNFDSSNLKYPYIEQTVCTVSLNTCTRRMLQSQWQVFSFKCQLSADVNIQFPERIIRTYLPWES